MKRVLFFAFSFLLVWACLPPSYNIDHRPCRREGESCGKTHLCVGGVCRRYCATAKDCPTNYRCLSPENSPGSQGYCLPSSAPDGGETSPEADGGETGGEGKPPSQAWSYIKVLAGMRRYDKAHPPPGKVEAEGKKVELYLPSYVAVHPAVGKYKRHVIVADSGNDRLVLLEDKGQGRWETRHFLSENLGVPKDLKYPTGLLVTGPGVLVVSDSINQRVLTISYDEQYKIKNGGIALCTGVPGFPVGLALYKDRDSRKNFLAIADPASHAIWKTDCKTPSKAPALLAGTPGKPGLTDGAARASRFHAPYDLLFLPNEQRFLGGQFVVADTKNQMLRRLFRIVIPWHTAKTGGIGPRADEPLPDSVYGVTSLIHPPIPPETKEFQAVYGTSGSFLFQTIEAPWGSSKSFLLNKGHPGFYLASDPTQVQLDELIGLATLDPEHLLVVDADNHRLLEVTLDFSQAGEGKRGKLKSFREIVGRSFHHDDKPAQSHFFQPVALAVDTTSSPPQIFVADTGNHRLRSFAFNSPEQQVKTLLGHETTDPSKKDHLSFPYGLVLIPKNDYLILSDMGKQRLLLYNHKKGTFKTIKNANGTPLSLQTPTSLAFDSKENRLFVLDVSSSKNRVLVLELAANFEQVLDTGEILLSDNSRETPTGLAFYRPSNAKERARLYLSIAQRAVVYEVVDQSPWEKKVFLGQEGKQDFIDGTKAQARFLAPGPLTVDDEGNLYILEAPCHRLRMFHRGKGLVSTLIFKENKPCTAEMGAAVPPNASQGEFPLDQARLHTPTGLAFFRYKGNAFLLIADSANNQIRLIGQKSAP